MSSIFFNTDNQQNKLMKDQKENYKYILFQRQLNDMNKLTYFDRNQSKDIQLANHMNVSQMPYEHKSLLVQQSQQISQQNNDSQISRSQLDQQQNLNLFNYSIKNGHVKNGKSKKTTHQQRYNRSSNNSHKKFISVARRWMFKNNSNQLKNSFQNKFHALRSTRTYFFIILAFIKNAMNQQKHQQFLTHFIKQINAKISFYEKQIQKTSNQNLKHFRADQITDLKFSIKASNIYFEGNIQNSVECVYKKDKTTIIKKKHYLQAIASVKKVEAEFSDPFLVRKMIQQYKIKKDKVKSSSLNNKQVTQFNKSSIKKKQSINKYLMQFVSQQKNFINQEKHLNNFLFKQTSACEKNENIDQKQTIIESVKKLQNLLIISPQIELPKSSTLNCLELKNQKGFQPFKKF